MPRKGVILIGEPKAAGTIYGSCFFKRLADQAPPGIDVLQTDGTEVENDSVLDSEDPGAFYHIGHGSPTVFTIENKETYIDSVTGERIDDFKGRVVHLLSCNTAQKLGNALVRHGAVVYIGYSEPFTFGIRREGTALPEPCSAPESDIDYYSFIDCDVEIERKLFKLSTVQEAINASAKKADEYIEKYSTGAWKDNYIAPYMVRFLRHNKDIQRVYGNKKAKLTTLAALEAAGWDPLKWMIETVEETRPKVPIEPVEDAVSESAGIIIDTLPDVRLPVNPPPKPPKWPTSD